MPEFKPHPPIDAGIPFDPSSGKEKYACLDGLRGRIGVYIFRHENDVLYVGSSYASSHGLKTRISQHYRVRDKGATFRINYCNKNCGNTERCAPDKKRCNHENEPSFQSYKQLVQESQILAFSVAKSTDAAKIQAVKEELIRCLKPRYTEETQKDWPVCPEYVRENAREIMDCLQT